MKPPDLLGLMAVDRGRGRSSGEAGFTAGTFAESIKGADGKVAHVTGKFLCVWKKQRDGSWKAVHDMWNYDGK